MDLGAFSISLTVRDIEVLESSTRSLALQAPLKNPLGDPSQGWLILKNGDHTIGLFQGMFEKNMLTFNPGWDANAESWTRLPTFAICSAG